MEKVLPDNFGIRNSLILRESVSRLILIMSNYYNVSSKRMARFLYLLGFNKESYFDKNNIERWRFEKTPLLIEAVEFFKYVRNNNRRETYVEQKMDKRRD